MRQKRHYSASEGLDNIAHTNYAAMQQKMIYPLTTTGDPSSQQEATTMNKEIFDEWLKLSKNAVEPMMRLNEITVRAMERVARQQLDVARDYLDLGTKQATIMSGVESPEDLLTEQGQLVSEFGERLINRAQEFAKIAAETQQAVTEWAEETTKKAEESAKKAAGAAKKVAGAAQAK
jgi:phasin family protein